jgi:hypothetical protein
LEHGSNRGKLCRLSCSLPSLQRILSDLTPPAQAAQAINYQHNEQDEAQSAASDYRPANVKAAAAKQKQQNDYQQ